MLVYWTTWSRKNNMALKLLEEKRKNPELNIVHIDGDNLRSITQNFDYSLEGRKKNIENVHTIARFMDFYDALVVISVVAPLRIMRDTLKETNKMTEVYVHTTNVRGREQNFAKNYEAPEKNFIDIDTTIDSVEESISKILKVF